MNPGPTATTADNSSSENSVLELPTLIARGNVHQGDTSFSEESRGRQCAFMALTSLAYNQHEMAVSNWQPEALDEILHFGDSQFLDALHRGFIPDAPNLSIEQLPTTPGGGGTSLWVRRGCAPVLGSFWPENSGIGVSFYWKISVIGVYFHSEFSGIGGYSKFCNRC